MTKQYRARGTDTPDAPTKMIEIDTKAAQARVDQAEQVPIFSVDGKVYSMPKVVRAEISLNYLQILRTRGTDEAAAYLVTETLGEEALDVLSNVVGLTEKEVQSIIKSVQKYALPKDRGRKGAA